MRNDAKDTLTPLHGISGPIRRHAVIDEASGSGRDISTASTRTTEVGTVYPGGSV